jgi:hypothetical protein
MEYQKPKFQVPMPSNTTMWPYCKRTEGCTRMEGHSGKCHIAEAGPRINWGYE